jgi:hypothetical protein
MHKKVIRLLRRHFNDIRDALEDLPGGRVAGVIISPDFRGLSHDVRQQRLVRVLRSGLTPDEFQDIGAIAVLTPEEASVKALG